MKKLPLSVISTLILLTGCAGGGEEASTIPPIPPQQNPIPTPVTPETPQQNNQNNNISGTTGLIPSTNPQDRLRQINQGRNDPFNTISPPAIIRMNTDQVISESTNNYKAIVKEPPSSLNEEGKTMVGKNNRNSGKNNIGKGNKDNSINSIVGNNRNNGVNSTGNSLSPLVPFVPPSPSDAEKITVSGILDLQGENVALIQTPWDSVTRSVKIGDIITDNNKIRVRVKDISFGYPTTIALREDNQTVLRSISDDNAVVVLEQFGQKVTRQIGENKAQEKDNLVKL